MNKKIIFRVYDISQGFSSALFKREFPTREKALQCIEARPIGRTYMIVEAIRGGMELNKDGSRV